MLIITTVDVVPAFAAMTTGNASRCAQLKVTSASASLSLFHVTVARMLRSITTTATTS